MLKLADTSLILINPSPSNVKDKNTLTNKAGIKLSFLDLTLQSYILQTPVPFCKNEHTNVCLALQRVCFFYKEEKYVLHAISFLTSLQFVDFSFISYFFTK